MTVRLLLPAVMLLALGQPALGQPATNGDADADAVEIKFDPAACTRQAAAPEPTEAMTTPTTWSEWEVAGSFVDPPATVRALLAPTMERHRALTADARKEVVRAAAKFGYHVVGIGTKETPAGTQAIVSVSPLPMIRRVDPDVELPGIEALLSTVLDEDIRRRMRLRTGSYLKWSPADRACELLDEAKRIEQYLHDEGYFEAVVAIDQKRRGHAVTLTVRVELGPEYTTDLERIQILGDNLTVRPNEIREKFRHFGKCIYSLCYGTPRFRRSEHQEDLQEVFELFHMRGYPEVRVRSDFDPATSFDRRTKTVRFAITIDQRRKLDVTFEGFNRGAVPVDQLQQQVTFSKAASIDDVEANESARAITDFLQSRGFFDAKVTWSRERFEPYDRVVFRIDQGFARPVQKVDFEGNFAIKDDELRAAIGTRPRGFSSRLFGAATAATSAVLATDVDRIADLYRRAGFREARVRVSASPQDDPVALDSAALAAALVSAHRGDGLYVRFTIDEGQPTLLTQIHVELGEQGDELKTPEDQALCEMVLRDLADLYKYKPFATPATPGRCVAVATNLRFREDEASTTRDELKDRLYAHGRPRAEVGYELTVIGPRRIAAKYKLAHLQELKIGKVVIRGNFKTRDSIILDQLGLKEGSSLTSNRLADGARKLRGTALFDSVNISMPDLDTTSTGSVNAVVDVTERYDHFAEVALETGYSSFNAWFFKLIPSMKNLFGIGVSLDVSGTIGLELGTLLDSGDLELRQLSAESTLRLPSWLSPWIFDRTELSAFHRRQDTPRFGLLRTTGATVAVSKTWQRPRVGDTHARAITFGLHYDFRSRERNVDALRPIGADDDESQVPITTRTGSVGADFVWEQRVDRSGTLSPLAPEDGYRLEAQVSYASPFLFGQDTFIKVSAAGSKYWPVGKHLVIRGDLRYDQGFPLGGANLLPEVERFFAGGDATVRGYDDERLATEVVLVGVPPLDNVQQIRILPSGGNIRMLASLDAQLQIWKAFATAVFIDAGMIKNQWSNVELDPTEPNWDVKPSVGMALVRIVTPFGAFAFERAVPLRPKLGDDPRGRWHISFAARAQF